MVNYNGIFFKILPFFSGILLIYWLFDLWQNLKINNTSRIPIDIVVSLIFAIGLIGGIVIRVTAKKQ